MSSSFYKVIPLSLVTLMSGCTLVDTQVSPNTKQYILNGIENNLSKKSAYNQEVLYANETTDVEELSTYVQENNNGQVQEVSNISNPIRKQRTFNSNLQVVSKKFDDKKVKIAIEEMPLNKFLHLTFGKVLGVDYVLDKSVQKNTQPVSINLKEKISKKELFKIINNMLEEFKAIVHIEQDIFYIKSATRSPAESVYKVYMGYTVPKNIDDEQVIYMMRPYFYNQQMNKHTVFVKDYFLSNNGSIELDNYENIIKIKDKVKNIRKALAFLDFIDQPSLRNKSMKLIRIENMDVSQFIEAIEPIIKNYGIPISKDLKSSGVQFTPIKQINALLLLSDKESWAQTVLFWKRKLDVVKQDNIESEFFVYTPNNRKAEELVEIINQFQSAYTNKEQNQVNNQEVSNQNSASQNASRTRTELEEQVKVVLDKERNNIIVYATKSQYSNIEKMLRQLDTLPKQVLIEVTIAEITLRDSMQFGLEWFLRKNASNYGLTLNALGAGSAGIAGTLVATSGNLGAAFNALKTNKYVNTLSNPKLLVLNNHSATINIGNQVPIVASQATASDLNVEGSGAPSVLQNIQYRNTGIGLSVKPTINAEGFLTLDISQNVSNAQKNDTSDISSPLIFNRQITTNVILKSGETVMLGGLISEDKSKDDTKIPVLGELPVLKHLFSTTGDSIDKTELVIMVKPTILSTVNDASIVTDALLDLINFQ
jgi:general secretion pathway protein D